MLGGFEVLAAWLVLAVVFTALGWLCKSRALLSIGAGMLFFMAGINPD